MTASCYTCFYCWQYTITHATRYISRHIWEIRCVQVPRGLGSQSTPRPPSSSAHDEPKLGFLRISRVLFVPPLPVEDDSLQRLSTPSKTRFTAPQPLICLLLSNHHCCGALPLFSPVPSPIMDHNPLSSTPRYTMNLVGDGRRSRSSCCYRKRLARRNMLPTRFEGSLDGISSNPLTYVTSPSMQHLPGYA
jgi:hypothetical protein